LIINSANNSKIKPDCQFVDICAPKQERDNDQ
jgi:hypothetical protein